MSLLVDPDYAIYSLRLAYLRKLDDHAGPRVITFPSILNLPQREPEKLNQTGTKRSGQNLLPTNEINGNLSVENSSLSPLPVNSHVVIAGLNDARYQPELATVHSPKLSSILSSDEDPRMDLFGPASRMGSEGGIPNSLSQAEWSADGPSRGKGSAGLKYTSTILGPGRSGALGMRVSGRRTASGDVPRRTKGGSKDNSLLEVDTVEEQASDTEEDATKRFQERNQTLDLLGAQFDSLAQQNLKRKSHRSSSFRMPNGNPDQSLALASFRNRSSSQPYHPAMSSGLRSVGSVDEEDTASTEDLSSAFEDATDQSTPKNDLAPNRPPRSSQRSELDRVQQNKQSSESTFAEGSSLLPLRRRSVSEGASPFVRHSKNNSQSEEVAGEVEEEVEEETESLRDNESDGRSGAVKSMHRMNSDSTILSLASPLSTTKTELSPKSRPVEYDPQRLSPLSTREALSSYQLTVNSTDASSSAASRFRATNSSPLSRKAIMSASMDTSENLDGNHASGSSSIPLGNSSGFPSLGKTPNLLFEAASRQLVGPDVSMDESLEGGNLSSPYNADAQLNSALGLDVAWSEENRGKKDRQSETPQAGSSRSKDMQRGRTLSPLNMSHRSFTNQSDTQRRARSDAQQQQQQWFASLKSDKDTIAQRFQSQPKRSGISALLTKHSQGPSNPFAAMYKQVAGGSISGGSNTTIEVYFPFANQNLERRESISGAKSIDIQSKSMSLIVRKDATMEDIIGYGLYCYVEEGWSPRLDESLGEEATNEEREIKMSTLGWTLRIVEDGEVDDDYPAIDRSLLVGKFGADELAVCEATPTQIKQHLAALPKVQRRTVIQPEQAGQEQSKALSTDTLKRQTVATLGPSARLAATAGNITAGSLVNFGGTPIFASSSLSKSVMAPSTALIFLRVSITPNSEVRYKTTIQVPSDMYLADILETICRKRQLADVDQWAFVVPEKNIVVPLDRTVESLQGNHDLALVRRQDLGHQAGSGSALTGQSTNPNASIFKRLSEPVHNLGVGGGKGIGSTYKSYTVNRKQASFLGRHERILTIDGDWIHIIPTDSRAFQAQTHTTSFPVSVISSCHQSRLTSSFKLIVARESAPKRYEFEAENSTVAAEIVDEINSLIKRTK